MDTRLLWEQVQADKHMLSRDRLVTGPASRIRCPRHPLFSHSFQFGRSVVLPFLYESLLMCLEGGDALPDILTLGDLPTHELYPVWLDD